jgi:hypothetical protein
MNAYVLPSYRALQRRRIAERRSRALFLPRTTQHVERHSSLLFEMGRVALALAAVGAWGVALVLLGS